MGIIPTQIKALSQHVLSPPGGAKPGFSRFPSHGGNLSSSRGGYGWHLAAAGKPSSTGSTNLMTPVAREAYQCETDEKVRRAILSFDT